MHYPQERRAKNGLWEGWEGGGEGERAFSRDEWTF